MPISGGLKLALQPPVRDDRRARFAHVELSHAGSAKAIDLVTDARGRLRYRLADGEYRLSLVGGPVTRFAVRDNRWTTVRLELT